jgi:uncharacterized protein (DUF1778 family)
MPSAAKRDTPLNIRATSEQQQLIDRAAQTLGKSRTEFMLEAACREAEDVLLDRVYIGLDEETFATFQAILDAPPEPTQALRDLFAGEKHTGLDQ